MDSTHDQGMSIEKCNFHPARPKGQMHGTLEIVGGRVRISNPLHIPVQVAYECFFAFVI